MPNHAYNNWHSSNGHSYPLCNKGLHWNADARLTAQGKSSPPLPMMPIGRNGTSYIDINSYWALTMTTTTTSTQTSAAATMPTAGNPLAQPLLGSAAIVDADRYFAAQQQAGSFYWDAAALERAIAHWQTNLRQLSSKLIAADAATSEITSANTSLNAVVNKSTAARLTVVWLADNSPDWIALDLACARLQAIAVPLPTYISAAQLSHVVQKLMASQQAGDPMVLLEQGMFDATGSSLLAGLQHTLPNEMVTLPAISGFSSVESMTAQALELASEVGAASQNQAWHCYGIAGMAAIDRHAQPNSAESHVDTPREDVASDAAARSAVATATQKITFTSGSTGQPKGVCLSAHTQWQVAQSLIAAVSPWLQSSEQSSEPSGVTSSLPRHLCLLPLPTLLENIAGVYAPLFAGGEVWLASAALRGFAGSRLVEPTQLLRLITAVAPKSLILVPELLQFLVQACRQGWQAPNSLQFIAVGGARVAPDLLQMAHQCGLPVFQGYGLSECGSVVALSQSYVANVDTSNRDVANAKRLLDSVGKVLPHTQVEIRDGEIYVKSAFLGYLGDAGAAQSNDTDGWVATGDLGWLDADGYLFVQGRRKNLLISSFGRNIHPEWVEGELLKNGLIQQAMVVGDGQPYCAALIFINDAVLQQQSTRNPTLNTAQIIQYWIDQVNQQLPDYAQVRRWHRLDRPFSTQDQTLTDNHRPRRAQIMLREQTALVELYATSALSQGSTDALSRCSSHSSLDSQDMPSSTVISNSAQIKAMVLDTNFVSQESQEV
jgi:long-subunit acyl-CoA synthetase (AMP-forming)